MVDASAIDGDNGPHIGTPVPFAADKVQHSNMSDMDY